MAYNLNFIDPRDFLEKSQPGLLENFAQIESFIAQDHETFGAADEGKHKQLTMPQSPALPVGTDWLLYAGLSGNTNLLESLMRDPAGVTRSLTDANIAAKQRDKWIILPSGIVIKWVTRRISTPFDTLSSYQWGTAPKDRPFNNQYWAIVVPNDNLAVDDRITAYVTNISDASKVEFRLWNRTPPTGFFPQPYNGTTAKVSIIAIGD